MYSQETIDRFWSRVRKADDTAGGCWIWTGAKHRSGIGAFRTERGNVSANRLAWQLVRGSSPARRLVRCCRQPACVNPDHWLSRTDMERFNTQVTKRDNGCWEWTGDRVKGGYGRFLYNGRRILAHRFIYEMLVGSARGMVVMHTCDNPPCVNPAHLTAGTLKDNSADMVAKGRASRSRARLSVRDVRTIRNSREPAQALAAAYGVTRMTIYDVRSRKTWRDA